MIAAHLPLAKEVASKMPKGKVPPGLARYLSSKGGFSGLARESRHKRAAAADVRAGMRTSGRAEPGKDGKPEPAPDGKDNKVDQG